MTENTFKKFIPKHSSSKGKLLEGLGMMNLIVFMGLSFKANRKKVVKISYQELADYLGVSKAGAQNSIYELEKSKLIKRLPPLYRTEVPSYIILG